MSNVNARLASTETIVRVIVQKDMRQCNFLLPNAIVFVVIPFFMQNTLIPMCACFSSIRTKYCAFNYD